MNDRMRLFADEYIKRHCKRGAGKDAAIAAGYKERSAAVTASKLLAREDVQSYINSCEEKIAEDLRKAFLFHAVDAAEALGGILTKKYADDRDVIAAAKHILDRAGFATNKQAATPAKQGDLSKLYEALESDNK